MTLAAVACARGYKGVTGGRGSGHQRNMCLFDNPRKYTTRVAVEGTARMLFKPLNTFFLLKIMHCRGQH
jgi:hypothetical protein